MFISQGMISETLAVFKRMFICFTFTILNLDITHFENSVDPDQLVSGKPADQDIHCFPLTPLFDLILYVPSAIFLLYRDRSSWVEPVLS